MRGVGRILLWALPIVLVLGIAVGLRDDAVFWYYAGRDRFLTMEQVLDMRSIQVSGKSSKRKSN